MYATISALEDMRPIKLCFFDKKSAQNFLALVNIYEDESGAGNGYSAYWPNYAKRNARNSLWIPSGSITRLDEELVKNMILAMYRARDTLLTQIEEKFSITYRNRGIIFSMQAFKIYDWLKYMYPKRTSWVFDPTLVCAK